MQLRFHGRQNGVTPQTEMRWLSCPTWRALAAAYTKALAPHVRSSRCVLAGISFNGLLAFEVAHQLRNAEIKVEMVMLLDTQAIYLTPRCLAWQKLINDWRNYQTRKSPPRKSEAIVRPLSIPCSTIYSMIIDNEVRAFLRRLVASIAPNLRYSTQNLMRTEYHGNLHSYIEFIRRR